MMRAAASHLGLTIVTPVFNAKRYIGETLASVLTQLGQDDQYVIVDDGSTDGTSSILAEIRGSVQVIRQANAGEAAAVNVGIAAARSAIVGVINADDPIVPGLLDAVRDAFSADPDLAAVYPDWHKIDSQGRRISDVRTYEFDYAILLAQHMCIPGPGAFFRPSVLGGEVPRDPRAYGNSDYDFWLRFGRHGARIRRIPRTLATWRQHRQGTTIVAQGIVLARSKVQVIERLFARPDLPAHVRRLQRQALSAAHYHAALVGLRAGGVPALSFAVKSLMLAPRWPTDVLIHQRRSLPHLAYAATQPISGAVHAALSPYLPSRFCRQAVLDQVYGLDVPTTR